MTSRFLCVYKISKLGLCFSVLNRLGPDDLVLVDIDDTVITPLDPIFRGSFKKNPYKNIINDLKSQKSPFSHYPIDWKHKKLGSWRLQRKVTLLDPLWPSILQKMIQNRISVFALTKIEPGSCGPIDKVEDWRIQELASLNVFFQNSFLDQKKWENLGPNLPKSLFKEGIFFIGKSEKGSFVSWIYQLLAQKNKLFKRLIVIDDQWAQLMGIASVCQTLSIPAHLYHFTAAKSLKFRNEPVLFKKQVEIFLEENVWVEHSKLKKN